MNLPRFAVRNPVAVNLLMWGLILAGAWSWAHLVREFFPNMDAEQVLVTIAWPGATPEEVEKSVTRLVERELQDVRDVERISSRVFEGLTTVVLEMEERANRDRVLNEVRAELDKVRPDLPEGAEEPEIAELRPQIPVIAVVIHGEVPESVLHAATLALRDELLDLPNVTEVLVTGSRAREMRVEVRPERLETHGLTFEEVGRAIARSNLDLPGGQLEGGRTNVRVRTVGETQQAKVLEALPIRAGPDGAVVRLSDVATVRDAFEDKVERGRFWRRPSPEDPGTAPIGDRALARAASLTVFKTPEQDAIEIARTVKAFVAASPERAGGALRVEVSTDLARFIEQRLDLMIRNARVGLVLVLLTLALFLELRVAFWVAVGLPVAFLGTFLAMQLAGATVNLISLFGLIVVLGLIVDDAIVIGENVFTKLREGVPPLRAAEEGATEVGPPVLAAVLTTCVAFAPLAFIEGRIGKFLGVLPVVVICALGVSLLEAFVILPSHLAHSRVPPAPRTALGRLLQRVAEARHALFEQVLPRALEWALRPLLRWRYVTVAVALSTLLVAVGMVQGGIVPFVLLQDTDAETVTADLEMAAGTPEEETSRILAAIEAAARTEREVEAVTTLIGTAFDDRGRVSPADPATVGQVVLELYPAEAREARGLGTSQDLLSRLRRRTADFPGVRRLSWGGRSGGPGGADIEVLVRGDDLRVVERAVAHVEGLLGGYTGVGDVHDDLELGKVEAQVRLLESGRLLGLATRDVAMQIRHALFGFEAQDLQIGDEQVTVRAILPPAFRRSLADLEGLRIATPGGARVPLPEVARVRTTRGYASLSRVDGKRAVTVRADVDQAVANTTDVTRSLRNHLLGLGPAEAPGGPAAGATALAPPPLPIDRLFPGVSVTFEGERKQTAESLGSLAVGFPAALIAIFAVIAIVFRSYAQPVIVMFAIPFGLVGAVFGHWVMGYPFTILSMIGVVALSGIVVNDGLILVDLTNRARRTGARAQVAVVQAARARLRPILLTSITTIVGLAPLMLETSFQAQFLIPMAVSIVFGLAFATVLTLLLLPNFYLVFEDLRRLARWTWRGEYLRDLPYDPGRHDHALRPPAGGAGDSRA